MKLRVQRSIGKHSKTLPISLAGIGTGGTINGHRPISQGKGIQALKLSPWNPDDALHGLEGLKHMASSIVPGIYHEEELDDKISVSTEDAYAMVYRLSQEEGILVASRRAQPCLRL